jgi:Mannose-6-phosphate isomerase
MLINFKNIDEITIKNFHGGLKEVYCNAFSDDLNRIMFSRIVPGGSNGKHQHLDSSEIMFVVSGTGYSITDGVKERLMPGVCSYCKKGSFHEVVNDGAVDLVCYNVVCKQ